MELCYGSLEPHPRDPWLLPPFCALARGKGALVQISQVLQHGLEGGLGRSPAPWAVLKSAWLARTAFRSVLSGDRLREARPASGSARRSWRARSSSHAVLAHAARTLQPAQLQQLPAVSAAPPLGRRSGRGRGPRRRPRRCGTSAAPGGELGSGIFRALARPFLALCPLRSEKIQQPRVPPRDGPTDAGVTGRAVLGPGLQNLVPGREPPRTTPAGSERTPVGRSQPKCALVHSLLTSGVGVLLVPEKSSVLLFAPLRPVPL